MRTFIFYLLFLYPLLSQSQSLSIEQLWNHVDKSLTYQQKELQTAIRKEELKELRTNRIPVFYIDANTQRNLIIPTTPVPAIAFDPNASEGAIIPLKFATKWSSKAGIQVEWNIFDPKRKAEERQKVIEIEKTQLDQEQQDQDWKRDATLAYASVVLASKQFESAQADSAAYVEILNVSKSRYEAGRESSSNYLTAQQEFERKRISLLEAWSVLMDADLELRNYINLEKTQYLSSDIKSIQSFLQANQKINYTLLSFEKDQLINELQRKSIRNQLIPTLTFNGYLGQQYFSNEFRLDRSEDWYGNSFINLGLKIPLSAYFTSLPTIRKIALDNNLTAKKIQQEQLNEDITNKQSSAKILAAQLKIDSYKTIQQLALQSKDVTMVAYHEGRVLLSDLNLAITAFNKATRDLWQADFDLIKLILD